VSFIYHQVVHLLSTVIHLLHTVIQLLSTVIPLPLTVIQFPFAPAYLLETKSNLAVRKNAAVGFKAHAHE
jgi:hypothetical protein